jgi:dienelactone hydrolase
MGAHGKRASRSPAAGVLSVLVLVAVLALAACGGTNTTASSSPSAAPGQAAVTTSPSPSWSPTMSPAAIPVVKPGQKPPPFSELKALFAYDKTEPLGFEEDYPLTVSGVPLRQISFPSGGHKAKALLVVPEGEGPFPVVVYAPGWLTAAISNAGYAVALAKKGYAALLIEEPNTAFYTFDAPTDIAAFVRYATQERRALDLLETMPEIDAKRIGFFGWSNGAFLGSLLAGLEDRIKAYVFLGAPGTTTFNAEEKKSMGVPTGAKFARWAAQISVIDNFAYLGHNKGAQMLFINGKDDPNAMHAAKAFLAAAPKGATWKVYSGGHSATPAADKFWQAWMLKNL